MGELTEELKLYVTITPDGDKEVRERTIIYRDGEVFTDTNHRYVIDREQDVPQEIADHIEGLKGKQPKRKKDPGDEA